MLYLLFTFSLSFNLFGHRSHQSRSIFKEQIFHDNLNDLLNDGINATTFKKVFKDVPFFISRYDEILNLLSNQSILFFDDEFTQFLSNMISSHLDLTKTLYTISPETAKYLLDNRDKFIEFRSVLLELGPHLCYCYSLNFDTICRLYDYIFINNERDGIIIGNIVKILQLPNDFIPQIKSIITFFSENRTIADFFSKINALPQYYSFIEKVKSLKTPHDPNVRYFSFIRVIDLISSAIDIFDAINKNIIIKFYNRLYAFVSKQIGLSKATTFTSRLSELKTFLRILQNYSSSCFHKQGEVKCLTYQTAQAYLTSTLCGMNTNVCRGDDPFDLAFGLASFMQLLASLPADRALLDAAEAVVAMIPAERRVTLLSTRAVPLRVILLNVTRFADLALSADGATSVKALFDLAGAEDAWEALKALAGRLGDAESLCDVFDMDTKECNLLFARIVETAKALLSNATLGDVLGEERARFFAEAVVPAVRALGMRVSHFAAFAYGLAASVGGVEKREVDFRKFVISVTSLFERILAVTLSKSYTMPRKVCEALRSDATLADVLRAPLGSLGVLLEMAESAAAGYAGERTTAAALIRSVRPASFVDVRATVARVSELANLSIGSVAGALVHSAGALSIDDVLPLKALARNAARVRELAAGMRRNALTVGQLSRCVGLDAGEYVRRYGLPFVVGWTSGLMLAGLI